MKIFEYFLMLSIAFFSIYTLTSTNQMASNRYDAEIVALLSTLNALEVQEARWLFQREVSPDMKKYAMIMIDEHEKSLSEIKYLSELLNIIPLKTPEVKDFLEQKKLEIINIKELDSSSFENAYMHYLINRRLHTLDYLTHFMSKSKNVFLKNYAKYIYEKNLIHLEHAKNLQIKINM